VTLVLGDSVNLKTVLRVVDIDHRLIESELSGYVVETIPTWGSINSWPEWRRQAC